jgi:nucleotidyltransferase/DNA polymerase involved in DNA repair
MLKLFKRFDVGGWRLGLNWFAGVSDTIAIRRCPEVVFVPPRFDAYRALSRQIPAILSDYAPFVEPLSPDEAASFLAPPPNKLLDAISAKNAN